MSKHPTLDKLQTLNLTGTVAALADQMSSLENVKPCVATLRWVAAFSDIRNALEPKANIGQGVIYELDSLGQRFRNRPTAPQR